MKRLPSLISLCAGALLLAAPVASACDMYGATTMHCADSEMESMAMPGCHGASVTSDECCDVRSAPGQIAALSNKGAQSIAALESRICRGAAPVLDVRQSLDPLADGASLSGLGRYTLFSSFLL